MLPTKIRKDIDISMVLTFNTPRLMAIKAVGRSVKTRAPLLAFDQVIPTACPTKIILM